MHKIIPLLTILLALAACGSTSTTRTVTERQPAPSSCKDAARVLFQVTTRESEALKHYSDAMGTLLAGGYGTDAMNAGTRKINQATRLLNQALPSYQACIADVDQS